MLDSVRDTSIHAIVVKSPSQLGIFQGSLMCLCVPPSCPCCCSLHLPSPQHPRPPLLPLPPPHLHHLHPSPHPPHPHPHPRHCSPSRCWMCRWGLRPCRRCALGWCHRWMTCSHPSSESPGGGPACISCTTQCTEPHLKTGTVPHKFAISSASFGKGRCATHSLCNSLTQLMPLTNVQVSPPQMCSRVCVCCVVPPAGRYPLVASLASPLLSTTL
jgi:hypothetical protein